MPTNGVECEDLEKAIVADDPEKFFRIGAKLPLQEKVNLLEFLRANVDVFAWDPYEAPGVDPNFICHRLNVNPAVVPGGNLFGDHQRSMSRQLEAKLPS